MRVYALPPAVPNNPYLDLLYGALARQGVAVRRGRPRAELPALLAARGPRILHLHWFDELTQRPSLPATAARTLGFLALLASLRARGARVVWTAHNLAPHETFHPAWAQLAYRSVARMAAATIAHGPAALDLVREAYGPLRAGHAIPLGSYAGVYGPQRARSEGRRALGMPDAGRLTLLLGALRPYKGVEDLLDAFAALPADTRGTLLVAGPPKDQSYAERLARRAAAIPGATVRPGYVPDDQLAIYLAAADLVALPYRRVLSSSALVLALSYGRAALAPDVPPVREIVRDGREGFLFASSGLRETLARALAHPNLDALGASGLAAVAGLGWDDIAARTAAVYQDALEARP